MMAAGHGMMLWPAMSVGASAGVNSASDLGGQRCGNHEGRGDSTGNDSLPSI
jgi:hypothetical protein